MELDYVRSLQDALDRIADEFPLDGSATEQREWVARIGWLIQSRARTRAAAFDAPEHHSRDRRA